MRERQDIQYTREMQNSVVCLEEAKNDYNIFLAPERDRSKDLSKDSIIILQVYLLNQSHSTLVFIDSFRLHIPAIIASLHHAFHKC